MMGVMHMRWQLDYTYFKSILAAIKRKNIKNGNKGVEDCIHTMIGYETERKDDKDVN